jgi:hypothetical protein
MKLWLIACQNQEELRELWLKCREQNNKLHVENKFVAAEKFEGLLSLISEKRKKFYEKEKAKMSGLLPRLKKFFKKITDFH